MWLFYRYLSAIVAMLYSFFMLRNLFIASILLASVTWADTASYAPEGYSLIFSDDFTGTSLDNSKWSKYEYAGWNVSDWRKYNSKDDALYGYTGSKLVLEAKHGNYTSQNNYKNSGYSEAGKTDTTAGYACGAVNSSGKFSFQYGYVEVKARHDCANGVWPAIWMLSSLSGAWPVQGEIDILEHLNFDTHIHQTLHYPDTAGTGHSQQSSYPTGKRGDAHTYGMLWEEGSITMYLDGVQTAKFTPSATGQYPFDKEGNEFYLILSNQIGGSWVGNTMTPNGVNQTSADGKGTSFEIDYVKVFGSDKSTYTAQTSAEEVTAAESQSFGSGETAIEIAGGDAIVADSSNVIAVGVSEASAASANLKMTQDANQNVNVVFSGTETFSGNRDGAVMGVDADLDGTQMKVSDAASKTLRTIKNAEIAKKCSHYAS